MQERDIVLTGVDDQGQETIDLPVTRLGLVEGAEGIMSRIGQLEVSVHGTETVEGKGPPTASTPGVEGQRYLDTDTGDEWVCTSSGETGQVWELTSEPPKPIAPAPFLAGPTPPENTEMLWIDTTAGTGGLKYWNGTAWVHVPVAYT